MSKYKSAINLEDENNTSTTIFNKIKNKSLVFDIGCASGYLAEVLAKKKKCKVVGLEIDEEDAKKAEEFCEFVLRDDIESKDWEGKLKGKKFDHIIFADVLEHLKDPGKVLERVGKVLKNDGSILISIPNVAHVSVRLELLEGKFAPESTGILDNTHLKYFTRETFSELAKTAGYKITDFFQSSFDFPENKVKEILSEYGLSANAAALKKLTSEEAVAFQYFFELRFGESGRTEKNFEKEKPIYFVKEYLKAVENDHEKFKSEQTKYSKMLEKENKLLKQQIDSLNGELNKSISNRIKMKIKKLIR